MKQHGGRRSESASGRPCAAPPPQPRRPRFRAPLSVPEAIVVASLVCGDLAAALIAISCTHLLIRMTGLPSPGPQRVTARSSSSPSSPSDFTPDPVRDLTSGSANAPSASPGLIAISTIATLPERNVIDSMIVQFVYAACLLLIGHYIEATTRRLLIYLDLWGASDRPGRSGRRTAETLAHSWRASPISA